MNIVDNHGARLWLWGIYKIWGRGLIFEDHNTTTAIKLFANVADFSCNFKIQHGPARVCFQVLKKNYAASLSFSFFINLFRSNITFRIYLECTVLTY